MHASQPVEIKHNLPLYYVVTLISITASPLLAVSF